MVALRLDETANQLRCFPQHEPYSFSSCRLGFYQLHRPQQSVDCGSTTERRVGPLRVTTWHFALRILLDLRLHADSRRMVRRSIRSKVGICRRVLRVVGGDGGDRTAAWVTAWIVIRVVLGIGESIAFPAYSKILSSSYFGETKRGISNAAIMAGLSLGPAIGMLVGGTVVGRFGWRPFFLVLGLGSLLWLIPWLAWMPTGTTTPV